MYGVFLVKSSRTELREFEDRDEAYKKAADIFKKNGGSVYVVELIKEFHNPHSLGFNHPTSLLEFHDMTPAMHYMLEKEEHYDYA